MRPFNTSNFIPKTILMVVVLLLTISACGPVKNTAIKAVAPVLGNVNQAIFHQSDVQLVRDGLPANILLVEGLIRTAPNNYDMLVMATTAFTGLALIVENDEPERATALYDKAKDYGIRALRRHKGFRKSMDDGKPFHESIKLVNDKKYLDALLWTGLAWGLNIMLNIDDPMALVSATDVKAIMGQVLKIDHTYFYGMAHVFFGSYYAILPSIFGGGPDVVQGEFDKAFEISDNKFLLARVFYARYYATLLLDEELFENTLNEVIDSDVTALPEIAFLNALAKEKAKRLLEDKDKYF